MNYNHALKLLSEVDESTSPDDMFELWFLGERSLPASSDFAEDCELIPYRDGISTYQNMLARRLLEAQATSLSQVLNKLLVWECVCGSDIDQSVDNPADTYNSLVCSAISDLRALMLA